MARNVTIHCNETPVGSISGRGDLVAQVSIDPDGIVRISIDDDNRPDFWAELTVDVAAVRAAPAYGDDLIDLTEPFEVMTDHDDDGPGCIVKDE